MKRTNRIEFSADDPEYKVLEKAAKAAGVPVATYCRMAALEKARKEEKK